MKHYFFDLDDGNTSMRDEEGLECASVQEARAAAIAALPTMVKEELPNGDHHEFVVRVRDEQGIYLFQAVLMFEAEWLVAQEV